MSSRLKGFALNGMGKWAVRNSCVIKWAVGEDRCLCVWSGYLFLGLDGTEGDLGELLLVVRTVADPPNHLSNTVDMAACLHEDKAIFLQIAAAM